jgi:hypothetical protein
MNTIDHIHDYHGSLPAGEAAELNEAAETQERIILDILRGNPGKRFAYFDIIELTGYDKDSAKRSLSNLSGSAKHNHYKDEYGRWPVIYEKDERKTNPNSGKSCGTYCYNPHYRSYEEAGKQSNLFGERKPAYRNGVLL